MIDLQLSENIITDSNDPARRFFRCWLDGSYNGEGHYRMNCDYVRENYGNDRRLRAFVIGQWCDYLAADNDCSPDTVRRQMVRAFTGKQLDALNAELIDDARDLVRDEMDAA